MANETIIPQIRFPEFIGNWEVTKLGDVGNFIGGGTPSSSNPNYWIGDIPWISSSDIDEDNVEKINITKFINNLSIQESATKPIPKNSVLIVSRVGIGKFAVNKDIICTSQDFTSIIPKKDNPYFIVYCFLSKKNKFINIGQGTSIKGFTIEDIKNLYFKFPKIDEQTKIADFITKVDTQIHLLEKEKALLEKYKKGISQKIFNQEIRFKDDNGNDFPDWEEKKLGLIGNTINGLTGKTKEDFGEGKPYIQYMQIFRASKIYTNEFGFVKINEKETQTKVKYGDVFFTTSSETPNEIGISSVLLDEVEDAYLNSFCFGFRPNSLSELVPEFAQFLFRSKNVRKEIIKLAQGSTRFNMSKVEFMKQKISLPCETEQQKIASFLSAIDIQIDQLGNQIVRSKSFKKGLLQKMFV